VFDPWRPFQPSLMLEVITGVYPRVEHLKGSPLCKVWPLTISKILARDKHFSLLRTLINYGQKMFFNIGPWAQCCKAIFICNLRISVISWSVCPLQAVPPSLIFGNKVGAYPSGASFKVLSSKVCSWPYLQGLD
jgi:hypothetical protein